MACISSMVCCFPVTIANGGGVTFSSGADYTPGGGISISSSTVQGDDTFQGENQQTIDDIQAMSNPINFGPSEAAAFAAPTPFAQMSRFTSGVSDTPEFGVSRGDALSSALNQAQYDSMPTLSEAAVRGQYALGRGGFEPTAAPLSVPENTAYDYDVDLLGLNMDPQRS